MRAKVSILIFLFSPLFCLTINSQPTDENIATASNTSLSCDSTTSSFVVKGTSSMHDWEMISQSCVGKLRYSNGTGSIDLESINIKVEVTTLKSGKKVMDKKCYNALKYEDHPVITYTLKAIKSIDKKNSSMHRATLSGTLNIAGVKKQVDIEVIIFLDGEKLNIEGSTPLKMSDFNVEPPTALLGTLKTGNDIIIFFNLNFIVS